MSGVRISHPIAIERAGGDQEQKLKPKSFALALLARILEMYFFRRRGPGLLNYLKLKNPGILSMRKMEQQTQNVLQLQQFPPKFPVSKDKSRVFGPGMNGS